MRLLRTAVFACSRSGKRRIVFGFFEFLLNFDFLLIAGNLHASHDELGRGAGQLKVVKSGEETAYCRLCDYSTRILLKSAFALSFGGHAALRSESDSEYSVVIGRSDIAFALRLLVLRWLFDTDDPESFCGTVRSFKLQPELILNGGEDGRT